MWWEAFLMRDDWDAESRLPDDKERRVTEWITGDERRWETERETFAEQKTQAERQMRVERHGQETADEQEAGAGAEAEW